MLTTNPVVLVNMPFASAFRPSIGLSLLKASLQKSGIEASIRYYTLAFAEKIGTDLYIRLSNQEPALQTLLGEWIFSAALFDDDLRGRNYIDDVLRPFLKPPYDQNFLESVLSAHGFAKGFTEVCAQEIFESEARVVGFTSVFQQHLASLAVAKKLKQLSPEIFIVFGGANCEAMMGAELLKEFPFVDAVVSGEGEEVFPSLIQAHLHGHPLPQEKAILHRSMTSVAGVKYESAQVESLDSLPLVDYDDYFEQWREAKLDKVHVPTILFETSRGCWWGERSHCIFCGLNGATMNYRSKSANRALMELTHLATRYPDIPIAAVDNILDMQYFKTLLPQLASADSQLQIFYEVKANLKKDQIKLLRDAGVRCIQPGIESFSTEILNLMGKGTSFLQNVQLLKWCKELNIHPMWNLLSGFPGESKSEYEKMVEVIPFLMHLPPPEATGKVRVDRFSPLFNRPHSFGITKLIPAKAYRYIFPFPDEVLLNLAYFFGYQEYQRPSNREYLVPLTQAVDRWQQQFHEIDLFSVDKSDRLIICDLRPTAVRPIQILSGILKVLYQHCDGIKTIAELRKISGVQDIEPMLQALIDAHLLLRESNSYLSLAIPLGVYQPAPRITKKFYEVMRQLAVVEDGQLRIAC